MTRNGPWVADGEDYGDAYNPLIKPGNRGYQPPPARGGVTVLTLPFPPSVNAIWRAVVVHGKPRVLLSAKGREYRRSVIDSCAVQRPGRYPADRLALHIELQAPTLAARDVDNYVKAVSDALTHAGVWTDDSQIDDLRVVRGPVRKGGRVVVTIRPVAVDAYTHAFCEGIPEIVDYLTAREGGR